MLYETLKFYTDLFKLEFQTNLPSDDPLRMRVVQTAPFQKDPTIEAPHLYLDINIKDKEEGLSGFYPEWKREGAYQNGVEIGGGTAWRMHLKLRAAPKVQKDNDKAYYYISYLTMRILYVLQNSALTEFTMPNNAYMENTHWDMIEMVEPEVYGGEQEWLSYVKIHWNVRIVLPWRFGVPITTIPPF